MLMTDGTLIVGTGRKTVGDCWPHRGKVEVAEGVESIDSLAFMHSTVTALKLPASLKTVDYGAFLGCKELKTVTFPEGVARIDASAFEGCVNLEEVHLPEGIRTISAKTFKRCAKLAKINIPASVREIGSQAFAGCRLLKNLQISADVKVAEDALPVVRTGTRVRPAVRVKHLDVALDLSDAKFNHWASTGFMCCGQGAIDKAAVRAGDVYVYYRHEHLGSTTYAVYSRNGIDHLENSETVEHGECLESYGTLQESRQSVYYKAFVALREYVKEQKSRRS